MVYPIGPKMESKLLILGEQLPFSIRAIFVLDTLENFDNKIQNEKILSIYRQIMEGKDEKFKN